MSECWSGGPIFLVGLMGAGKTTLGKLMAAELHLPFYDTDDEIQHRSGADIPWIFDVEGEQGFRDRETHVLEDMVQQGNAVVSTGGGIVVREENRALLKSSGHVVYLCATAEQLYARIGKDKRRPLLQTDDPLARLRALLASREGFYRDVADQVFMSDNSSPKDAAKKLAQSITAFYS